MKFSDNLKELKRREVIQKMKPKNADKWGEDYTDIPLMPFKNLVTKPREPDKEEPIKPK